MPIIGLCANFFYSFHLRQIIQLGLFWHLQDFAYFQAVHIFAIECVGIGVIQSDQRAFQTNIGRLYLKCKLAQGITALHLNSTGSNVTTFIASI